LVANKKNLDDFKKYNTGILAILKFWGNAQGLSDAYVAAERDRVKKEKEWIRKEKERIEREKREAELKKAE
jgi:hypothetical protein